MQQRVDDGWNERILPRTRYFPANRRSEAWANSSPMSIASVADAPPSLAITGPSTTTKDPFDVTLTFDKAVTGFAVDDITVTSGSKGMLTAGTGAKANRVWTLRVTPLAGLDGSVTVAVAADQASHRGSATPPASTDFAVDTRAPELSQTDGAVVFGAALVLSYNEALAATAPSKTQYSVRHSASGASEWTSVTVTG